MAARSPMLWRGYPLTSAAMGRVRSRTSWRERATRSWEIHPGETVWAPPAVFEDEDLRRVEAVAPGGGTIEDEVRSALGGESRRAPTTAYVLEDAVLEHGHVWTSSAHLHVGDEGRRVWARGGGDDLDRALLTDTLFGSRYFGHWLFEAMPRGLLAEKCDVTSLTMSAPSANQREFLDLAGLGQKVAPRARCRELVVVDERRDNRGKGAVMRELRRRIVASCVTPAGGSGPVYLSRGEVGASGGGPRALLNEAEVLATVRELGFEVIDPASWAPGDLAARLRDCPLAVGIEGSQMANACLLLPDGATVFTLIPPRRFTMVLKDPCDVVGLRYGFMVGHAVNGDGFGVDIERLRRRLDEVPG